MSSLSYWKALYITKTAIFFIVRVVYCQSYKYKNIPGIYIYKKKHIGVAVSVLLLVFKGVLINLVPRQLPDFISQPWRIIVRRPGNIAML